MFKWANLFVKSEFEKDILSPDGRVRCRFSLKSGQISYKVWRNEKCVINESKLSILICGEKKISNDDLRIVRASHKKHEETFEMPWGEDRYIENNYNETAFYLAESAGDKRLFTVRFRVFNDGVAFRYEIPPQPKFRQISIRDENTEFNVGLDAVAYKIPAYQPDRYEYSYEPALVSDLVSSVHTPLTLRLSSGDFVAIHEAALYDYGSMNLKLGYEQVLKSDITPLSDGTKAHCLLPFKTPWRLIMLADSAIELTTNRLISSMSR